VLVALPILHQIGIVVVLAAIDLNDERTTDTREIEDVAVARDLPSKMKSE
jgi:hypothetical protein